MYKVNICEPHDNLKLKTSKNSQKIKNLNKTLKECIKTQEKKTREKDRKGNYNNNQKTINKMAINTYLSINYFKCKWTKCYKRHRWVEWI